jgi:hypothetical protein
VLGRNIYQCACGSERKALAILSNLREELARIPADAAAHLLNGMLFEVYFDKAGEFRVDNLKGRCLAKLLKLQTVRKFESSISFIRRALQPYKAHLPFLPSTTPEVVMFDLTVKSSDPPLVKSLTLKGQELLIRVKDEHNFHNYLWKLSFVKFTIRQLKEQLAEAWSIPLEQLEINSSQKIDPDTEYRIPKGFSVRWPERGIPQ